MREALFLLFLFFLPLLSILGTYSVNFYHNNILLLLMVVAIASVVVLIVFRKSFPTKFYPFAVFAIAVSLLYHYSLISMYLNGADIHLEYYFANLVLTSSHWDASIPENYNAMLSIVMLAPTVSIISGLSLTWTFKLIYPLLFSLVPVVLYQVYKKQTNERVAFLAILFFMSMPVFYVDILWLARMQIAELFLALLIWLMIHKGTEGTKKAFLSLLFILSLIVSHYGVSYVFIFMMVISWVLLLLSRTKVMGYILHTVNGVWKFEGQISHRQPQLRAGILTWKVIALYVVFMLTWHVYVSGSSILEGPKVILRLVLENLTDLFNPKSSEGLYFLVRYISPLHEITKILNFLANIFVTVGLLGSLLKVKRFFHEYLSFSITGFGIAFACIATPYITFSFNTPRTYHLTLFFLSPFLVIGGETTFRLVRTFVRTRLRNQDAQHGNYLTEKAPHRAVCVGLVILLLFNTGFVYEIARDQPNSIPLSQESLRQGDSAQKIFFYSQYVPEQEVFSAKWLSRNMLLNVKVYSFYFNARYHALSSYGMLPKERVFTFSKSDREIDGAYCFYLTRVNVEEELGTYFLAGKIFTYDLKEVRPLLQNKNKIYSNGSSEILI